MQDCVYHKGRVHGNIGGSEGSDLVAPIDCRLLDYELNPPTSLTIYCDSQTSIHLINKPIYHAKTKHIDVRYHYIQELVIEKKLKVWRIDIEVNIVDCLTKPLPDQRFGALRTKMGLRQATEQKKAERGAEGKI